jgi:hypothetical protein
MAAMGRMMLGRNEGIVYLATVREDGSPQVHPVMPYEWDGRLWVFIVEFSSKFGDLVRDGRYAFHTGPGGEAHEEFHVSGRATMVDDVATRTAVAASAGIHKEEWELLFELSVERALATTWSGWGTPGIRPSFLRWSKKNGLSSLGPEPRATLSE